MLRNSRLLSSLNNPRVKSVTALSRFSARLKRQEFVAEGPANVREALKLTVKQLSRSETPCITSLYATEAALENYPDIFSLDLRQEAIERFMVTEEVAAAMGDAVTSQGVLAVCKFQTAEPEQIVRQLGPQGQVLVACGIQDPGNAGTMIRIADAVAAAGVFFAEHDEALGSVDIYNPKTVRSTAGSIFHIPVVTGAGSDWLLKYLKQNGFILCGTDARATRTIDSVGEVTGEKIAWLFGNESRGLSHSQKRAADILVSIPIYGAAESLNVAAAATVCLYETAFEQNLPERRQKSGIRLKGASDG